MSKEERFKAAQEQMAIVRTYREPYIEIYRQIFTEYFNEGYSAKDIASEIGWLENSVKQKLTTLGLNWRDNEPKEDDFSASL